MRLLDWNMMIKYLIAVNLLGFLLYVLNVFISEHTKCGKSEWVAIPVAAVGGSPGVLIAILLFDRKAKKDNAMTMVFALCFLVIQIIAILLFKGNRDEELTFDFYAFFERHKILTLYLVMINILTFVLFGIDKLKALKEKQRIPVTVLMGTALFGGALGASGAMYIFRHKIRQKCFTLGIPMIIITWVILVFYMMNI